jgi:AraC family transcriptional regulator
MQQGDIKRLKAGEHYGSVFNRQRTPTAVFSESVYGQSMGLPEHSHELGFFTLIIDGHYSETIGSRNFVYSPRTVLWRQADLTHTDRIEAASSRFFFVEIEESFGTRMRESEQVPDHFVEKNGRLTHLATRLRNEVIVGDGASGLIAEGITLELLGTLTRAGRTREKLPPRWLIRVVDRLNDEFASDFSSEELGREANVHPVHLASVFRQFYNESMGEYVQNLRVAHASRLLANANMPLAEIACECGFADQSHFTRVFKRRTGTTPGAFRSARNSGRNR